MKNMETPVNYSNRIWLNKEGSASTGSAVAFDGFIASKNESIPYTFLEISDCTYKVRLHQTDNDSRYIFYYSEKD